MRAEHKTLTAMERVFRTTKIVNMRVRPVHNLTVGLNRSAILIEAGRLEEPPWFQRFHHFGRSIDFMHRPFRPKAR